MKILVMFLFCLIFIGCSESVQITKEDCQKDGRIYKEKKVLNLRTGLYENRAECI